MNLRIRLQKKKELSQIAKYSELFSDSPVKIFFEIHIFLNVHPTGLDGSYSRRSSSGLDLNAAPHHLDLGLELLDFGFVHCRLHCHEAVLKFQLVVLLLQCRQLMSQLNFIRIVMQEDFGRVNVTKISDGRLGFALRASFRLAAFLKPLPNAGFTEERMNVSGLMICQRIVELEAYPKM